MEQLIFVYVTCPSENVAQSIAQSMLEKKLAACANIIPGMSSMYWWDGAIQNEKEAVLILKTTDDHWDSLESAIKSVHPYLCPCIVGIPLESVSLDYAKWLREQVKDPSPK